MFPFSLQLLSEKFHTLRWSERDVIKKNYVGLYVKHPLLLSDFSETKFYIHGSVHRESNLITVQQDATYSFYYISVGSSTCFGCWHPSSGARTTVITDSGIY